MLDERNDPAGIVKFVFLLVTLIFDRDEQPTVEERQFAQPLRKDIETEHSGFEDFFVGLKTDFRTPPVRMTRHLEPACWNTTVVALDVNLAASPNLEIQPL